MKKLFTSLALVAVALSAAAQDELYVEIAPVEGINAGSEVTLTIAKLTGTEPFTYRWETLAGEALSSESSLTLKLDAPTSVRLTVTDATEASVSTYADIDVYGSSANATFDDLGLAENTFWNGRADNVAAQTATFYSGGFAFDNSYMPEWMYYSGFAASTLNNNDFVDYTEGQFKSVTAAGHESAGFGVLYANLWTGQFYITTLKSMEGSTVGGVYLCNDAYTYNSITKGDGYCQPFADGDYHRVVFRGDDPEGQEVVFYLADFRDGKQEIITDWTYCDLSPLGCVKKIEVTTESSNDGVPSYACLDNLSYTPASNIDINVDNSNAPVEYFNLQGQRVANPAAGQIYIRRQGSTASKIRF